MKTNEILSAYNALAKAKLSKLTPDAKVKVINALVAMKKVAEEYQAYADTLLSKLKGEEHDRLQELLTSFESGDTSVSKADVARARNYFRSYNAEASKCAKDALDKEAKVKLAKLTKKEFDDLLASNADMEAGVLADVAGVML